MKIWLHRYSLTTASVGGLRRDGALLKIEWRTGHVGHSDLHPWTSLGDPPLEQHLASLEGEQWTTLVLQSLKFNWQDGLYRRRQRNAFLGLALPRTHLLVSDIQRVNAGDLRGWSHVKVKMGKNWQQESAAWLNLCDRTDCLWRLDFNGQMASQTVQRWWGSLNASQQQRIDFVEDPVSLRDPPLEAGPWADDWLRQPLARVRVVKPSRESANDLDVRYKRIVFTHSLDHVLGRAMALWAAAQHYREHPQRWEVGGFGMQDVPAEDPFVAVWPPSGAQMRPPPGTGFGFDEILASLRWERVI